MGSTNLGGDADAIGERLEVLTSNDGKLRPEDVLKDAKKKRSPLHHCFEWDDTEAARQHRLAQARYVIRSIEIVIEHKDPGTPQSVAVNYVNLGERNQTEPYTSIKTVMSDEVMRKRYVLSVLRELQALRVKYRDIKELADVFAAIVRVSSVIH